VRTRGLVPVDRRFAYPLDVKGPALTALEGAAGTGANFAGRRRSALKGTEENGRVWTAFRWQFSQDADVPILSVFANP